MLIVPSPQSTSGPAVMGRTIVAEAEPAWVVSTVKSKVAEPIAVPTLSAAAALVPDPLIAVTSDLISVLKSAATMV